jgi:3'(2'), 5'-bisphosphate nucleotidase
MRRDAQLEVALDCVRAASSALLALRAHPRIEEREVLAQLGDNVSHSIITDALHRAFPDDVVLSEEGEPVGSAQRPCRLWVVDPLDGTKEYSSRDRDDWAVQVALVEGESPVLGIVALPAQGVVLHTSAVPRHVRGRAGRLRIAVSRTRRPEVADALAAAVDADLVPMGSVGAKVAAVIAGIADLYLHAGGQYEWDSAGPVAVARAAGLVATRLDGTPLRYNQPDPYLPDLLIARPDVAPLVRRTLAAFAN